MAKSPSKRLDDFISNNIELIAEYDSMDGVSPFESCKYDILSKLNQMQKAYKGTDFKGTLYQALQNSIQYQEDILTALSAIHSSLLSDAGGVNVTQQYFKEVGEIYRKYKNEEDFTYCPENRDKLISLNTKMVISVAKQFQGLGLSLSELISAGNLGLCVAWDKYDPTKSHLQDDILAAIDVLSDHFTQDDLLKAVDKYLNYGNIKDKLCGRFHKGEQHDKKELIKWVTKNIHNAKFSSVAMMWIQAYIKSELDNCSRVVKKPKSEIYKDKEATGSYSKECLLNLDSPIAGDTDTTFADTLCMHDETNSDMDVMESYDEYKNTLNKLLEGVGVRDRAVTLLSFGIGVPRPLLPKEIAEKQGLSVARISQVRLNTLNKMRENAAKYEIDPSFLFECCSKFR